MYEPHRLTTLTDPAYILYYEEGEYSKKYAKRNSNLLSYFTGWFAVVNRVAGSPVWLLCCLGPQRGIKRVTGVIHDVHRSKREERCIIVNSNLQVASDQPWANGIY